LYAEAAVRHWLDVRAISSSNISSSAAREGKKNGRAGDSWVRPEPRSRGKTFLRRLGVEQPRLGPCRRKDLNWSRSSNASPWSGASSTNNKRCLRDFALADSPQPRPMLRTYVISLTHLLNHERRMSEDARAKKGETLKKEGGGYHRGQWYCVWPP
jgi:hypothetical protein